MVGCAFRAIPELAAYPHPIGYDVINYYLPVVTNFDSYWPTVSGQFPLYVILLHAINLTGLLNPYLTVIAGAIGTFGLFSGVIFLASRSLMKLKVHSSIFLTIFVMFQLAVLRASWDEHRDILALSTAILAFVLIGKKRANIGMKTVALSLVLCGVTVASDRQVGALFCATSLVYSLIVRTKISIVCTIAPLTVFALLFLFSGHNGWIWTSIRGHLALPGTPNASPPEAVTSYGPLNLMVYFIVMDALLVPTAIIGFNKMHNLLKIGLLITMLASFSWIILPNADALVANRWITLAGIFLSIFSARGILKLFDRVKKIKYNVGLAASILSFFLLTGLQFALWPYDKPFLLFAITRDNIQDFGPVTMQFNSIQLIDNDKIISAISWINQHTEHDAVIVGQKHWLGFMELYLKGERSYYYSDDPQALAETLKMRGQNVYLISFDGSLPSKFIVTNYSIIR